MKFELAEAKWWQKVLLLFIPSYSLAVKEHGIYFIVTKKNLFNTTYIINVEQAWDV